MLCATCGNTLASLTPILSSCSHCDSIRACVAPAVPIPYREPPPQPPPAVQETDLLGQESACPECGGPELKVTPIMSLCQKCGRMRSLTPKSARDDAKEEAVLRELILVRQVLRTRGLPRLEAVKFQARLEELENQCP